MSTGFAVMLFGVFVVPGLLLWAGHRLRRRPAPWRGAFWGAVWGHIGAIVLGSIAAMSPAAEWAATDTWRGLLGFWSFAMLPLIGGAAGWVARRAG